MPRVFTVVLAFLLSCGALSAQAQIQTSGALVVVTAFGEVTHPNDEARATLTVEEQDKDKAVAASRVNQKMKQGVEIIKREDPQAMLKTRGYYTYPVYADEGQPRPTNRMRHVTSWRVGQYLDVTTSNLLALPKTIAGAQSILALNGIHFGLTAATGKKLEEQRIAAAYINLTERIAAIAKAMGRNMGDAVLDTVDFEGVGAHVPQDASSVRAMRASAAEAAPVEHPNFEPGETTLSTRVVGKFRFK